MRPSLIEIRQTEQYLDGQMEAPDAALFEARVITNPRLRANVYFLQKTFSLLRLYNKKKLKEEVAAVHDNLFSDPGNAAFQQQIRRLFKR